VADTFRFRAHLRGAASFQRGVHICPGIPVRHGKHIERAEFFKPQINCVRSAGHHRFEFFSLMSRASGEYAKAFKAKHAIQDYIFTDGSATDSIERRFAGDLDVADEVIVYAKLPRGPRGFYIPTPVGNYSPDWAISFKKGAVKHIFFIAETKGTMDSLELRPIEQAKISCAKKLFNEISTTGVKYHDVDSYQSLLDVMQTL
jgi:restriction endonuclease